MNDIEPIAGRPIQGREEKPTPNHRELARGILLFKASKGGSLIQQDGQGSYVDSYDETDISMYLNEDQRKILINLLQMDFVFGAKNNQTELTIAMSNRCAKKIAHYSKRNNRRIAVYSKELMTIAKFVKAIPYTKTKRFDVGKVLLFSSRIRIGAEMFSVQLNVFDSKASGYLLYDINKISQAGDTSLGSRADSGIDSIVEEG